MKVLSLFDGISCGMVAMQRAGVNVEVYHAYEIDKYAVQVSEKNYPEIVHHGDVFKGNFSQFNGYDWLIGGSPCTYWSVAQSSEKRETTASGIGWELFSQYVRALQEAQPAYFLYENNDSMSDDIRDSITETFGFEPIMIDSALLSGQSRKRLYWVGKRNPNGIYERCSIAEPRDKGILLTDVLEGKRQDYAIDSKYQPVIFPVNDIDGKSRTIKAQYANTSLANASRQDGFGSTMAAIPIDTIDGKSHTITANYSRTSTSLFSTFGCEKAKQRIAEPVRVGHYQDGGQGQRIYSVRGKSVTLAANGGGWGAKTGLYKIDLPDGDYFIRKLTPIEAERLQTLPDNYTDGISDTQRYKCIGNGWTVDVIAYLIASALQAETEPCYEQLTFF